MKRLRKKYGKGIRFFHCGEYGEQNYRPHYHALIFGLDFDDKELYKISPTGERYYTSKSLSELWPYGFAVIGNVTFESAAYVARYVMKKITGENAEEHYKRIDEETGEVYTVNPEYITMSRRPGIGRGWYDKYWTDVYPGDFVVVRGQKMRPPKFYDRILESHQPFEFDYIKHLRKCDAAHRQEDNTRDRLDIREKVKRSQIQQLKRTLE